MELLGIEIGLSFSVAGTTPQKNQTQNSFFGLDVQDCPVYVECHAAPCMYNTICSSSKMSTILLEVNIGCPLQSNIFQPYSIYPCFPVAI